MSAELRDLLHRVADDVAPVRVDADTWARARRARRRERLVVPLATAALVAVVAVATLGPGGLLGAPATDLWADRPSPAQPLPPQQPAVPARVHSVPESLDMRDGDGGWSTPRAPADGVSRASVSYVLNSGSAVLVDAHTGEHVRVALPGFDDRFAAMQETPTLALSPDGLRVAYSWGGPFPEDGERRDSGVAVLDLGSREPQVYRLPFGSGVRIEDLHWSPGGRYLLYNAVVLSSVTPDSYTSSGIRMERLDTRTGERTSVPYLGNVASSGAVSERGDVVVPAGQTLYAWPRPAGWREHRDVGVWEPAASWSGSAAWAADGRRVVVGERYDGRDSLALVQPLRRELHRVPLGEPAATQVLGWVGNGHVAAVRHRAGSWDHVELVLAPVDGSGARVVGEVDSQVSLGQLSVATDLMTPQRPTVEFAAPSWARDRRWWWVGSGALVALGAAALLAVRRRQG